MKREQYISWRLMAGLVWRWRWALFIVCALSGALELLVASLGSSEKNPFFLGFIYGPLGAFLLGYDIETRGARLWECLPISHRACTRTLWIFSVLLVPLLQALVIVPFATLATIREPLEGKIMLGFGYAILVNTTGAALALLLLEILFVIKGKEGILARILFLVCALLFCLNSIAAGLFGIVGIFSLNNLSLPSLPEASIAFGVLAVSYLGAAKLLNRRMPRGNMMPVRHIDKRRIPTAFPSRKWSMLGRWTILYFLCLGVMVGSVIYFVHNLYSANWVDPEELYLLALCPSYFAALLGSAFSDLLLRNIRPWRMLPVSRARLALIYIIVSIMFAVSVVVAAAIGLAVLRTRLYISPELTARLFGIQCICLSVVPLMWMFFRRSIPSVLGPFLAFGLAALSLFRHADGFTAFKWSVGILGAFLVIGPVGLYRGISGSRLYRRGALRLDDSP